MSPYRSSAQRAFFHTATARKEGITPEMTDEWDDASKGLTNKDLPKHVAKREKAKERMAAAFLALGGKRKGAKKGKK